MRGNDLAAASPWRAEDVIIDRPQSREFIRGRLRGRLRERLRGRLRGRENFAALNRAYPAAGRWTFAMNRTLAERAEIVTDMTISDGAVVVGALTFRSVRDGLIARQTELWPDDSPAPDWRARWVEHCWARRSDHRAAGIRTPRIKSEKRARASTRPSRHSTAKPQAETVSTALASTVSPRAISIRRGFSASGTSRTRSMCSIPSACVAPLTLT